MENLEVALQAFRVVQERHRRYLAEGRLANLWQWQGEREKAFRSLLWALAAAGPPSDPAAGRRLEALFADVLAGERELAAAAERCRQRLGERLTRLRHGRRCLRGYGSQPGGTAPRHLRTTT